MISFGFDPVVHLARLNASLKGLGATARIEQHERPDGSRGVPVMFVDCPDGTEAADVQAILDAFDDVTPDTSDEKTAAVRELADAKLMAAHNELLWARLNSQSPAQWAIDLVNAAHAKIAAART